MALRQQKTEQKAYCVKRISSQFGELGFRGELGLGRQNQLFPYNVTYFLHRLWLCLPFICYIIMCIEQFHTAKEEKNRPENGITAQETRNRVALKEGNPLFSQLAETNFKLLTCTACKTITIKSNVICVVSFSSKRHPWI